MNRTKSLSLLLLALGLSAPMSAGAASFVAEQRALGVPLKLSDGETTTWARLELPRWSEVFELGSGRRVKMKALRDVPVRVDGVSGLETAELDLFEVETQANSVGRAKAIRRGTLRVGDEAVAQVALEIELDLMGLASAEPHVTLREARLGIIPGKSGPLAKLRLQKPAFVAGRLAPLHLEASRTQLTADGSKSGLVVSIRLAKGFSPTSLRASDAAAIRLVFSDGWSRSFRASVDTTAERRELWSARGNEGEDLTVEWHLEEGLWVGTLRTNRGLDHGELSVVLGDSNSADLTHLSAQVQPLQAGLDAKSRPAG